MLIFHKERLVVLATPKTGSTALETALSNRADIIFGNPPGLKHMRAERFRKKFQENLFGTGEKNVELIAVMREPVDWLGSWYRYRSRPALRGHANNTEGLSFDEFVNLYLHPDPPDCAKVGSQARFLCDGSGDCLVDRIFDYSRIHQLYQYLSKRLNVTLAPSRINQSPHVPLELKASSRNALHKAYANDIALYEQVKRQRA